MLESRRKSLVWQSVSRGASRLGRNASGSWVRSEVALRLRRLATLCFSFTLVLLSAESHAQLSPFNVGERTQLFVDRVLVREAIGVAFTLHPARKHPANPLVKADRPWEGWRALVYGGVLFDKEEGLFKMWYAVPALGYFDKIEDYEYVTCYATSPDGIRWDKPLLGGLKAKNGEPHNAVARVEQATVIKEPRDPDPARRYKMIGWSRDPRGFHTFVSPDGVKWTNESETPIAPLGRPYSDVITGFWDDRTQQYVAFPKLRHTVRGISRRCFTMMTSPDFKKWTEPQLVFAPDLRDDAGSLARIEQVRPMLDVPDDPKLMRTVIYGIGAYPAESCTIAFPWMFSINNNARYGNHEGPSELQLAASRDLLHWERHFRTPCVPRGKPGEWDSGFFTTAASAFRFGDEIRLYYGGSNYTHGTPCLYRAEGTGRLTKYTGSIGLATWKLDRFVSVDGPAEGGTLVTNPIRFNGKRLEINAETKRGGRIVVELLDPAGLPLDGFQPSDPFTGDDLRHTVKFGGKPDVSSLKDKAITLRFTLKSASLYSFAFRN